MIKSSDVKWEIECLPEDLQIEGYASAIDEETDAKIAHDIRKQLEKGNEWAWCVVKVTGEWEGLEKSTYLGGCSYRSERDFVTNSGYFEDMKADVLEKLNKSAKTIVDKYQEVKWYETQTD